ncbi:MAG: carbon-nitrogen hydrolase family protein [Myxococcota bacterium]
MRVGLVQYRARKGDGAGSRGDLVRLATAAAREAQLVVLPEMAATGYAFADAAAVRAVAEPADGPTAAALGAVARAERVWLVAGFPEQAGDRLYNSALVLDPQGRVAFVYRKTLLYDADVPWATPGDSGYRAFETDFGRFGVGICMDLNDDAFVDWVGRSRLDAVAFPTNWVEEPGSGIETWAYWAWRMAGQKAALVAANTWGTDGAMSFTGLSAVLQGGRILASLPAAGDGAVVVTLD